MTSYEAGLWTKVLKEAYAAAEHVVKTESMKYKSREYKKTAFGYVIVSGHKTPFLKYCKLIGRGQHVTKLGAWVFDNPGNYGGPRNAVYHEAALAFAQVLAHYGISSRVQSRELLVEVLANNKTKDERKTISGTGE